VLSVYCCSILRAKAATAFSAS